jgi:hypothetical protein
LRSFFGITFLASDVALHPFRDFLHRLGELLGEGFVDLARLQSVQEGSYEHLLVWIGDLYSFLTKAGKEFSK